MPELAINVTSLSAWTSNPVGGVRFGMRFPPPRAVGVADLGAAVAFLLSSKSARESPSMDRGEGLTPPMLRVGG